MEPENRKHPLFHMTTALLLAASLCIGTLGDMPAEAKKKKGEDNTEQAASQAEAELKKNLEPLNKTLLQLLSKIQGRALLSPEEAGKLVEIRYKLIEFMSANPTNPLIVEPVYQAATLYLQREEHGDAYEFFSYLSQNFPATHYGIKAKYQIAQLEKRFGAENFPAAPVLPPVETAAEAETKKPEEKPKK